MEQVFLAFVDTFTPYGVYRSFRGAEKALLEYYKDSEIKWVHENETAIGFVKNTPLSICQIHLSTLYN